MRTRVKICCIQNRDEARLAIRSGADCIGLVAEMPSGPGPIADDVIADIAVDCPPGLSTFLLTSRTDPGAVVEHVIAARTNVVQLVDAVPTETYDAIRDACPAVRIVQVVHVEGGDAVGVAEQAAPHVDAILLDSGRPNAAVKELGGTGRTHDWEVSSRVVAGVPVPVYLAGGLSLSNVAEAIETVRPFGVDLCSGVRVAGALDADLLREFMSAVRATGSAADPT